MKRFLLAVALYLAACHGTAMPETFTLKPLPDSLNRLWRDITTDTLVGYTSGAYLRVYRWQHDLVGIYQSDTTCMLLRKNSQWWLVDTLPFRYFGGWIDTTDLNGDGYTDLLVSGEPANGNYVGVPVLSDANGSLKVYPHCKHPNFTYVPELHVVRAYWAGSWYSTFFKEEYVWKDDSLILREGVRMLPPASMEDNSGIDTLEYYRMQGDREYVYKRLISDSSWQVYDHALWEGFECSR
ncbi:FG-GAP repeat protein [Chitinophaga sp. Cy-1792]|uniref:FG-GAP repeat protein n=1 Tax=Chitinophaga sp. Cy-1792 TaxID=2608339 RepID=UPI0014212760|nr:FG-GAP repeat protein [Chitinophaga sp. Cy-1792]NIG54039.1 hypothetical protein [Chitinophaga sp. Cy-1792]